MVRRSVFARVASAAALLHPALHDDSPLTVAEAVSLGTPVICLAHGGPPVVAGSFPDGTFTAVAAVGSRDQVATRLASAADRYLAALSRPSEELLRPTVGFGEMILDYLDRVGQLARSFDAVR
jgi:glycosyltransferase involved in cell wall biosynthesis